MSKLLIISHRGANGDVMLESTIQSIREVMELGVDMIEMDIRLTRDRIPVLSHNLRLFGTRKRELALLRRYTLAELQTRTAASGAGYRLTTLDEVLHECFGRVYLNLEIKETSAVGPTLDVVRRYTKKKSDWDCLMFSSFKPLALRAVRRRAPHAVLAMLHYRNPLVFLGWHRFLRLSAVGFHRLYTTTVALTAARQLGLFTYIYTINRPAAAKKHAAQGVDGIVTDLPEIIQHALEAD